MDLDYSPSQTFFPTDVYGCYDNFSGDLKLVNLSYK